MDIKQEIKRIALTVNLPIVMKFNDYHGIKETEKLLNIFGKVNSKELDGPAGTYIGLFWEGQEPDEEKVKKLMIRAGIRVAPKKKELTKDMIYHRWEGSKLLKSTQEAWGDSSIKELVTPAGWTNEEYAKALNSNFHGSYPRFSVENGKVIEEDWRSIGD